MLSMWTPYYIANETRNMMDIIIILCRCMSIQITWVREFTSALRWTNYAIFVKATSDSMVTYAFCINKIAFCHAHIVAQTDKYIYDDKSHFAYKLFINILFRIDN